MRTERHPGGLQDLRPHNRDGVQFAGLDLAGALIAELPSPDARLDDPFRRAFNDYDQALRHCLRGGENSDPAELAIAGDLIAVGDQHWRDAAGMIDDPWLILPPSGSRPAHVFKT